ncbi:hypothetical protein [Halorussus lipolyticus]|uniref:hypothetical protein n=1 Tax=Halorussus lipolyticus TaxID=3034024 RepID=UPI0023E8A3C1|nr:hypothetical protein [Halorussus sp. DT80]
MESNRRKTLKALGITGLSTIGFTSNSVGRTNKYVGVAYNPETHEVLGDASGQFNAKLDQMVGALNVMGEKYQISQESPEMSSKNKLGKRTRFVKQIPAKQPEKWGFKNPKYTLKIFTAEGTGITGYIANPVYQKVAFSLAPNSPNVKAEMKKHLKRTAPNNEVNS